MSSGLPSMFKTPRHRTFDYKPVFYDEQKERKAELEQLVAENKAGAISDNRRLQRLRGKLSHSRSYGAHEVRQHQSGKSKIRLVIILAVLVALVWGFFNWF